MRFLRSDDVARWVCTMTCCALLVMGCGRLIGIEETLATPSSGGLQTTTSDAGQRSAGSGGHGTRQSQSRSGGYGGTAGTEVKLLNASGGTDSRAGKGGNGNGESTEFTLATGGAPLFESAGGFGTGTGSSAGGNNGGMASITQLVSGTANLGLAGSMDAVDRSAGGFGSVAGAGGSSVELAPTGAAGVDGVGCVSTVAQCSLTKSDVVGTWHLRMGESVDALLKIGITNEGALIGDLEQAGVSDPIDAISLDPGTRRLDFRNSRLDGITWFRVSVADGVLAGRYSKGLTSQSPALMDYLNHVTGWRERTGVDGEPLVYDVLTVAGSGIANHTMRLTRHSSTGRFKQYAGSWGEDIERSVLDALWQADRLTFSRVISASMDVQLFSGSIVNGVIAGNIDENPIYLWKATPSQVFAYGLDPRDEASASSWRVATRNGLRTLTMAGAPRGSLVGLNTEVRSPVADAELAADRDDDPSSYPQSYDLEEHWWTYRHSDGFTAIAVDRQIHGFVATPTGQPPTSGFPLAIVLNGHGGSAYQLFDASNAKYWYGDAFARRGYVVIGIDISHRVDSAPDTLPGGDDPTHGNEEHPAIVAPGVAKAWTTDWEEDGERAWDVMRVLDYAESLANVDRSRIVLVGLELGGEVALLTGALDERVAVTVVAGYAPDIGVLRQTSAHPCYEWRYANLTDYIDTSDLMALIAPRALIVETGIADASQSLYDPPFGAAKQVLYRARRAFRDANAAGRIVHYLHDGTQQFRVGERSARAKPASGVLVPFLIQPAAAFDASTELWQTDPSTQLLADSLFSVIDELVKSPGG